MSFVTYCGTITVNIRTHYSYPVYRFVKRIHLGWFVPVPILLFIYFLSMISYYEVRVIQ